jgi:predicted aspartyl protease
VLALAVSWAFAPAQMHGAEAANVVRLSPLAAVLIVGAVASRRRLSEMAVQSGAWVTAMVLVVTLYGYRFELHELGRRIMGELAPTKGRTRDADSGGYRREQRRADQGRRSVSGSVWISCGSRTASTPPNGTTRGAYVRIDRVVIGPIAVDNVAAWVNEGDLVTGLVDHLPRAVGLQAGRAPSGRRLAIDVDRGLVLVAARIALHRRVEIRGMVGWRIERHRHRREDRRAEEEKRPEKAVVNKEMVMASVVMEPAAVVEA